MNLKKNSHLHFKDNLEKFGDQRVISFLKSEIDGWPMIDTDTNPNRYTTMDKIVKMHLLGNSFLFDIYMSPNPKDPNKSILKVNLIY